MALTDALHAFQRQGETGGRIEARDRRAAFGGLAARRSVSRRRSRSSRRSATNRTEPRAHRRRDARCSARAVERRNLRELACSTVLFDHYRGLHALLAAHTRVAPVSFDDLALAGRAIPPATLRAIAPERLARVRAHYEEALLELLRAPGRSNRRRRRSRASTPVSPNCAAPIPTISGVSRRRRCGRCASARTQRRPTRPAADARASLRALQSGAGGSGARVCRTRRSSLVRATLALLWRDFALYGAAPEDTDHVDVLRDYGLTVAWHVAATQASEAAWEAGRGAGGRSGLARCRRRAISACCA